MILEDLAGGGLDAMKVLRRPAAVEIELSTEKKVCL